MGKKEHIKFIILYEKGNWTPSPSEKQHPNIFYKSISVISIIKDSLSNFSELLFYYLDRFYLYDSMMYRFAAINKLGHYIVRKNKSRKERKAYTYFYDYRLGERAGFPFPQSTYFYKLLHRLYYKSIIRTNQGLAEYIKSLNPDIFIIGRVHLRESGYIAKALNKINIPILGIVSSWDHPTTKGVIPPEIDNFIVASRRMKEEMHLLHDIPQDNIYQIGKVQMDNFVIENNTQSKVDIFSKLGIPLGNKLVTFSTNTHGLKIHEVSIANKLSEQFSNGEYGENVTFYIRGHPQDDKFDKDFYIHHKPPQIICKKGFSFGDTGSESFNEGDEDQKELMGLMKYSDIVLQGRGSICLDAVAFDTPVISIGFDGDLKKTLNDSFLREYEFEHYKPIVKSKGTWLVGSYKSLREAIIGYLSNPKRHSKGRRIIKAEQIEPLDGESSKRTIDCIESLLTNKTFNQNDSSYNYSRIGKIGNWQEDTMDIREYVK
jgi:hypothetical protein